LWAAIHIGVPVHENPPIGGDKTQGRFVENFLTPLMPRPKPVIRPAIFRCFYKILGIVEFFSIG